MIYELIFWNASFLEMFRDEIYLGDNFFSTAGQYKAFEST